MTSNLAPLRRLLFGISPDEAMFERRGFHATDLRTRERFETVGRVFIRGYLAALETDDSIALNSRLTVAEPEFRGFAFEGAAMALALLDALTPWNKSRWQHFVEGSGEPHIYMAHIGMGWALSRLGGRIEPRLERLDPVLRWLVPEGMGFHDGYFHPIRTVRQHQVPERLTGYARRAYDQGVGRSVWFSECADGPRVTRRVAAFPISRQGDVWSGVGLASAYAGGARRAALERLRNAAGRFLASAAQGAAFAAKARLRAGLLVSHTETACETWCGISARAAADVTDEELCHLPADGAEPAFEIWRRRIQARLAPAGAAA